MPLPILAGIAIAFAGGLVASIPTALTGIAAAALVAKKVGDGVKASRAQQVQDRVQESYDLQFLDAYRGDPVPEVARIPKVVANEEGFWAQTEMDVLVQHGVPLAVTLKDGEQVLLLLTKEEKRWLESEDSSILIDGSPRVRAIVEDQQNRHALAERLLAAA